MIAAAAAERQTPPPPNRGGLDYRDRPKACSARGVLSGGDANILAHGWDTYEEAWNVGVSASIIEMLDEAKEEASAASEDGSGSVLVQLGGEPMLVSARGAKGGVKWWLDSDDGAFTVRIRSPKMGWPVSIRYNAFGLWAFGLRALRQRVVAWVRRVFALGSDTETHCRVSLAHFAFDVHSPKFSAMPLTDFLSGFVAHQEVKARLHQSLPFEGWVRSSRFETITIGPKNALQIQVYDKGKEISDVSGKDWMLDIWRSGGWQPDELQKPSDIWRVEVRMGKDYLRERNVLSHPELIERLSHLLCEALQSRRLAVPQESDSNRSRWPTHWMWAALLELAGDPAEWCGRGRRVSASGEVLADMLKANVAGTLRSLVVLHYGDYDEEAAQRFVGEIRYWIESDPYHTQKIERSSLRYSNVHAPIC